jgi:ectoine hydroxylase-related dioxygenase (phytanoyl-CoA dioxygenase family)
MRESSLAEQFATDGYALVDHSVFSDDLLDRAVEGMDMIRRGEYDTGEPPNRSPWSPGDDENLLCKIEIPQKANRAMRELVSHPALGELAARVTGAKKVQVWWTQMLYKPLATDASSPTGIGWHQDRNYWQIWEGMEGLFTAWVALSDVTEDSGPMKFVPGSNHWGDLNSDFYGQDNDVLKAAIDVPEGETWSEVPALLPRGGVSFHHCYTLHGSGLNHSAAPRRSLAIHMRTEKPSVVEKSALNGGLAMYLENFDYNPVIYGD